VTKSKQGHMADAPLDQRHAEDRACCVEVQGALRHRHFQVRAEVLAILRCNQHPGQRELKRQAAEGVVLPRVTG
jgi:hypothetical protein